jgi:hypothetical protein
MYWQYQTIRNERTTPLWSGDVRHDTTVDDLPITSRPIDPLLTISSFVLSHSAMRSARMDALNHIHLVREISDAGRSLISPVA